jgi:amino-acid N-acetyltransferase
MNHPAALGHVVVRPPHDDERAAVRALLASSALPVEDLSTSPIDFLVAVADGRLLGVVGLEAFDGAGLLRSLAVRTDRRGTGLGDALVRAVEDLARARRLAQLVLLTQTAAPFFAARGYTVIDRAAAPAAVLRSAEFASICPASATCMAKPLSP